MFSFDQREFSLRYCHGYQETARRNTPGTNCHIRFSMSDPTNVAPSPKVMPFHAMNRQRGSFQDSSFSETSRRPGSFSGLVKVNDGRWRSYRRRRSVSVWVLLLRAGFLCRDWNAQPACEMLCMDVTHCVGFSIQPVCRITRLLKHQRAAGFLCGQKVGGSAVMPGETCLNLNGCDAVINACGYKRAVKLASRNSLEVS